MDCKYWCFLTGYLTFLVFTLTSITAFPEIGISSYLGARLPQSSSGWIELSKWKQSQLSDSGRFLFGAQLEGKSSRFEIPRSGIYFLSMAIHISHADAGVFRTAFVINGKKERLYGALTSARRGHQGVDFSLVVSGFADLRSNDRVSVFAFSETDKDWIIEKESQFSLRYAGPVGSFPAFAAEKSEAEQLGTNSINTMRRWDTSGYPGLFTSLSGFSPWTGEFIPICDGIYFITANILIEADFGWYSVHFAVNGQPRSPFVDGNVSETRSLFTTNLQGSFFLKRGDVVTLQINASKRFLIRKDSGFSACYIDSFDKNSTRGISLVTQTTNEIPGTGWMELTNWPLPSKAHVQFYNKELLKNGRFECDEGGIYYVAVSLRVQGGKGNFALLVKTSGTSQLSGNAGLYTSQHHTQPSGSFSMSVTGLLELSKGQRMLVFLYSSFSDRWLVQPGSGLSVMKSRHYWPAANSYIDRSLRLNGSRWEEITNWKQTGKEGTFAFGSNFHSGQSRFTVSLSGVYFVSTNLLIRSEGYWISAVLAVNGQVDESNGLYATHAYPPNNLTLNIAGALDLQQGQNVSVFVRLERNSTWEVIEKSGFSVVFIGNSFAVLGFHIAKASKSTFRTNAWVEIDDWKILQRKHTGFFQNGAGLDNIRGIYVAPISGIYFASCTLIISNVDVDVSGSYFEMYIGVNGQKSLTNGLQNTKYIYGTSPSSGSNVMTMTVSGFVQLSQGDYAVIRARASMDYDWKVEDNSGFTMFLVSPTNIPYGNVGFLSRKGDTRIKSVLAGSWSKIGGWATQSDLTNGLFLKNDGSFSYEALSGDLTIKHVGIYFISANIILSNTPESCELGLLATVSDETIEQLHSGLAAVEQRPRSKGKYTLQFSGAVFLAKNQKIHLAIKSGSADAFTVWEGSGFSIARLIYPIEKPGFYARLSNVRIVRRSNWHKITGWDASGGKGRHIDGRGFNAFTGEFIVPLSGIYLASSSIAFRDASNAGILSVKLAVNNDESVNNGLESNQMADDAYHVVVVASGSMELLENMVVSAIVRSDNSSSLQIAEGSYFTMRYISASEQTEGNMADRYSDNVYTSPGWKELVSWKTAGTGGQFQVGSVHQTTDRFSVPTSGVYFITANIQFLGTNGLVIIGIVINSGNDTALTAKRTCAANGVCSLNLAASVELKERTFVSVYVYSNDDDGWIISSKSSKSNLRLKPVPPTNLVHGFLARYRSNFSAVIRQPSEWIRIGNWSTSDLPGCFDTINGFSPDGVFIVRDSGVFTVSVNVILRNTGLSKSDYELLVAVNGKFSPSNGLYSRQSIFSLTTDTLNIMAVVHLYKWDTLTVLVSADGSFEVLQDSTFSIVNIALAGGPFLCSSSGPFITRELSPASVRTVVGSSVTWSCEAVGETTPKYRWLKNFEKMPNRSSSSLNIVNATVEDSGDYACVAEIYPISAGSNIASLTVYDPKPTFQSSNYKVTVDENGPLHDLVLNISVRAESREKTHANMAFRIVSGNAEESFFLLPNVSATHFGIYTACSLDREEISSYQLHIEAVNIDEHAQKSAIDVDITVADQNDNAPVFDKKNYDVTILENATVGRVVLVVNAHDRDKANNENVDYIILAGSGTDTFTLNSTSGEIILTKRVDHESQPKLSLFIAARDPDFTAFTEVTITVLDVNEHRPYFGPLEYHVVISEAAVAGTSVLQLSASDRDAGTSAELSYKILTGDPHGLFAVDENGLLTVARLLDHETNTTHNLTVSVHDQGETTLTSGKPARVFIRVRDVNDNSPVFEISFYEKTIKESTPPGTSILLVRAVDLDKSRANRRFNYSFVADPPVVDFVLDSTLGTIYVNRPLDFERKTEYRFQVAVCDSRLNSRMDVTSVAVLISDENDNYPVFYPIRYNVSVSETETVGANLVRIYATDKDSSSNADIKYSITSGNENSTFVIDNTTGILILISRLDRERVSFYNLTISAVDKGLPSLEAQIPATVVIKVFDENDNKPMFVSESYAASIYENAGPGSSVLTVRANDRDFNLNQNITYVIASFSEPGAKIKFDVDHSSGKIFTKANLDREEQEVYKFIVIARDGGKSPQEGFTSVVITLIDVNDNPPKFKPAHHQIQISAEVPIGSSIITLSATDPDSGTGGEISFYILNITGIALFVDGEASLCVNHSSGAFTLHEHTGTLKTANTLAAKCVYSAAVQARDHGSPSLSSVITIGIETTARNVAAQGNRTTTAIVSREDFTKVIVIVCVFLLIIAIIITLVVWREARRYMRKRSDMLARRKSDDGSSEEEHETIQLRKCFLYHQGNHPADCCSTTTEMPSSLQTPHSPHSSGVETDLLETFTTPYNDKEGYIILEGDTESYCVSIDFGLESDVTFPALAIETNAAGMNNGTPEKAGMSPLLSSFGSKRSQASLPAKLGSRNRSQKAGIREVISDTHL